MRLKIKEPLDCVHHCSMAQLWLYTSHLVEAGVSNQVWLFCLQSTSYGLLGGLGFVVDFFYFYFLFLYLMYMKQVLWRLDVGSYLLVTYPPYIITYILKASLKTSKPIWLFFYVMASKDRHKQDKGVDCA